MDDDLPDVGLDDEEVDEDADEEDLVEDGERERDAVARKHNYQSLCFVMPPVLDLAACLGAVTNDWLQQHIERIVVAFRHFSTEVDHHVQKFDEYLQYVLPQIIRERAPLSCEDPKTGLRHTLRLGEQVCYTEPCLTERNGVTHAVTPDECLVRRLTYALNVLVSVTYTVERQVPGTVAVAGQPKQWQTCQTRYFDQVLLMSHPVMIGSRYAPLSANPLHMGGYFIIGGNEKVILPRYDLAYNRAYVFADKRKDQWICEVRSAHPNKYRSTATVRMHLGRTIDPALPYQLEARLPFLKTAVPMGVIFRVLGATTSQAVSDAVLAVSGPVLPTNATYLRAVTELVASLRMEQNATIPLADVLQDIGNRGIDPRENSGTTTDRPDGRPDGRLKHVAHLLRYETLPHIGVSDDEVTARQKCLYFAYMVHRMLVVTLGFMPPDNRDNCENKRAFCAGYQLAVAMRQLYTLFHKHTYNLLSTNMERTSSTYSAARGDAVQHSLANADRLMDFLWKTKRLTLALQSWFHDEGGAVTGGKNGKGRRGRRKGQGGPIQLLPRFSNLATLSLLGRLEKSQQLRGSGGGNGASTMRARLPAPNEEGRVDPVETPEGPNCGLTVQKAVGCVIRLGGASDGLVELCMQLGVAPTAANGAQVLVNGVPIGFHSDPVILVAQLRAMRRTGASGRVPWDTGISHYGHTVTLSTDAGALLRPLFVAENLHRLPEILADLHDADLWLRMLRAGVVEFIDAEEEATGVRRALNVQQLLDSAGRGPPEFFPYTHLVVHTQLHFGLAAGLTPFPHHDPLPRNSYQAGMAKQAISEQTMHPTRQLTDSHAYTLWYGEPPLVSTWTRAMVPLLRDAQSTDNYIVAVVPNGYVEDDAIIFNQSSIDCGTARITVRQRWHEESSVRNTEQVKIKKPDPAVCIGMHDGNYDTLDAATGVALPGTLVPPNAALIGRVAQSRHRSARNRTVVQHNRTVMRSAAESFPAVVDRAYFSQNRDGNDMVTLTTRELRVPEVGDKFSSQHGQKGVIGITLSREDLPFTADGMVPDVIMSPHAFVSRMTVGHKLEGLHGLRCALDGVLKTNANAFCPSEMDMLRERMRAHGLGEYGEVEMYCGLTGRKFKEPVTIAVLSFMRLRHLVGDKWQARGPHGPLVAITRQPTEGRHKNGGPRLGEMERDCLDAHGMAQLLRERLRDMSDMFETAVCTKCGLLAINELRRSMVGRSGPHCFLCGTGRWVTPYVTTWAAKLTIQELMVINAVPRLAFAKQLTARLGAAPAPETQRANYWRP